MSLLQSSIPIHIVIDPSAGLTTFGVRATAPVSGTATATFQYLSNGNMTYSGVIGPEGDGWCKPAVYTQNHWVRMTLNSGFSLSTGTMNTWLQMNANRTWTLTNSVNNSIRTSNLTFEIARDSGGADIVGSVTFEMSAEVGFGE